MIKTRSPLLLLLLAACTGDVPVALGTLEYDLIHVPATAFERIASVAVREGQQVIQGDTLLVLESARIHADVAAAAAEVERLQSVVDEAVAGPRRESIAEAQARLQGALGVQQNAHSDYARIEDLVSKQLVAKADLDRVRSARTTADANVSAAREAWLLLTRGTRKEQLTQTRSALAAAKARRDRLAVDAARTRITAPRTGRVDSLPFKAGDQVQVGTTLATLLVGDHPYARVYVPQALRQQVRIGSEASVLLEGSTRPLRGHVRSIRSEPSFTPYYALSGKDASRLSWLAEIELDNAAANLPTGMPLRAAFGSATPP
jgi:HlyD family secretion protein